MTLNDDPILNQPYSLILYPDLLGEDLADEGLFAIAIDP